MRRDAADSRARLVEAARSVFAEQGCEVPMSEIAAAAELGVATLSRHFTRAELLAAVIEERLVEHLALADEALARPAAKATASYLRDLCELRRVDRSVTRVFTLEVSDAPRVAALRAELHRRHLALIAAGRGAGVLRAGIVPQDLLLVLIAMQGVIVSTTGDSAWERAFELLVSGLAPGKSSSRLPGAPRPEELAEAVPAPARGRHSSPISGAR
jgi:AcrR family transcriptional regulator